jgi:hypothetical protein
MHINAAYEHERQASRAAVIERELVRRAYENPGQIRRREWVLVDWGRRIGSAITRSLRGVRQPAPRPRRSRTFG